MNTSRTNVSYQELRHLMARGRSLRSEYIANGLGQLVRRMRGLKASGHRTLTSPHRAATVPPVRG